jgi:DNA-binding CsgD family transcriptional regulator
VSVRAGLPLIQRENEWRHLQEWVDQAVRGRGRVVLIEGEAGIGKTVLAEQLASYARESGMLVLRGAGEEIEAERPFGVIVDAFMGATEMSPLAVRVVASVRAGNPDEGQWATFRFRLIDDAVEAAEALALERPTLIVVDDAHWADPSSLVVVHRLASLSRATALLVVLTARPVPQGREMQRLAMSIHENRESLDLHPLTMDAVSRLAGSMLGAEPGPVLTERLKSTAGNPLFVRELLSALERDGLIRQQAGRADIPVGVLPPSLRLTILRRVSFLSQETLNALKVGSVLGSTFAVQDLAVVLDTNTSALLPLLEEALAAKILVEEDGRLAFGHDLVRDAIYEDVPLDLRRALHMQAGSRLAEQGAPASQVAAHLTLGARVGDVKAVTWLRRAATEVASKAPGTAADLLREAQRLAGPHYPERNALAAELVRWLVFGQRFREGERAAQELLAQGVTGAVAASVRRDLGVVLCFQGQLQEGIAVLEAGLADPTLPEADRALFLAELAAARSAMFMADPTAPGRAAEEAEEAARIARRLGDRSTLSLALGASAYLEWVRGNLTKAAELATQAVEYSAGAGADLLVQSPHAVLAGILRDAERGEEGERAADAARRLAESIGDVFTTRTMLLQDGLHQIKTGQWDDAAAGLEAALVLGDEHGLPRGPLMLAALGYVAMHRDNLATARRLAEEILEAQPPLGCWLDALLAEAQGHLDRAVGRISEIHIALLRPLSTAGFAGELARICVTAGAVEQAQRVLDVLHETAQAVNTPGARATELHVLGLLSDSTALLAEAIDLFRVAARPLHLALACEDAANALLRDQRRPEAFDLVREACSIYEGLGAQRHQRRAEATGRSWGMVQGVRGTRRRPATGWDSLTETERRVIELVGDGLTNRAIGERLYISRRTVETHLSHVFQKLGASSRTELAAAVGRGRGA